MSKNIEKVLQVFLNLMVIYLIGDGAIHLFNIRLQSVQGIWAHSALSYATLLNGIYASFVFLVAALVFMAQKDLKKYKDLIFISAIWALFHGLLLIYLMLNQNFASNFLNYPSLFVWIPFYNEYLCFEAGLAFLYAILVFVWWRNRRS